MLAEIFTLTALIWIARALAVTAGTFVLLDYVKLTLEPTGRETPPYNRLLNARAWALAATGAIIGGVALIYFDLDWTARWSPHYPRVASLVGWAFLAAALVQRAASRAEQPLLIYGASVLIVVAGRIVIALGGGPM